MDETVNNIPDSQLLKMAVRSAATRRRKKEPAWSAVSKQFCLGSTYAMQLCRRFNIDPDSGKEIK